MKPSERDNALEAELERNELDAERWRKVCKLAFSQPGATAVVIAPFGATQKEVDQALNDWIDRLTIKGIRD